jgi:hypothetical protein
MASGGEGGRNGTGGVDFMHGAFSGSILPPRNTSERGGFSKAMSALGLAWDPGEDGSGCGIAGPSCRCGLKNNEWTDLRSPRGNAQASGNTRRYMIHPRHACVTIHTKLQGEYPLAVYNCLSPTASRQLSFPRMEKLAS